MEGHSVATADRKWNDADRRGVVVVFCRVSMEEGEQHAKADPWETRNGRADGERHARDERVDSRSAF